MTITDEMMFRILVIVCVSKDVIDKVRRPDGSIGLTPKLYTASNCDGQLVCEILLLQSMKFSFTYFVSFLVHSYLAKFRNHF